MATVHKFTLFADYFQFHLLDEASKDDFSTMWTEDALKRMLAVGQTALCAGTLRNVDVEAEISVLKSEVIIDPSGYDHIVEASLSIPTGKLVVMGCTDFMPDAPRINLQAGNYQVLYAVSGVDTIKTEWEPAEDKYVHHLWPGMPREAKLIKHWKKDVS